MKKASEYRQHADECHALAMGMEPGDQRNQLLEMAATWEKLAADRSDLVRRHPELALEGERQEEARHADPASTGNPPAPASISPPQAFLEETTMPTNEAGLSAGKDQGDGGPTTASDMPGGERNSGVSLDEGGSAQVSNQTGPSAGHLGAAGDPAEGKTDPAATGQGPAAAPGSDADQANQAPHVG